MNENRERDRRDDAERHPSDLHRRRRGKNIALAVVLGGLVVLFYIVAIVKMSGN